MAKETYSRFTPYGQILEQFYAKLSSEFEAKRIDMCLLMSFIFYHLSRLIAVIPNFHVWLRALATNPVVVQHVFGRC